MDLFALVQQFPKMLYNLDQWLDKATAHAKAKSFEVDVLVQARLAPDQYPLVRQVQAACDSAKFSVAYLTGLQAPAHPDTEQTMAEVRQRIKTCVAFLETIAAPQLSGGEARRVAPPWLQGKWMTGEQYLVQAALPNFYFHVTTAYAILRHNGVPLGKMDYIGSLPLKD